MTAPEPRVLATGWTVTVAPDDHPDKHLFTLEIEDMQRRDGGASFRVGRRLGPHWLCGIDVDPRGIAECKHQRPGCQWASLDDAITFAKRLAPTLAVIGDYDENTATQHWIDLATAIEMGELP